MRTFLTAVASITAVNAVSIPTAGYLNFVEPPTGNFMVNSTTTDAKADGSRGYIIEPDLVVGVPGKDGGIVKKIKFGPYTLKSGEKKEFPIGTWANSPSAGGRELPCRNCYITAMQLNLEYPDGTIANVDTGAWYDFRFGLCMHRD
jgi:hypothetical protein